ncbi:MAG: ferrous iron transport protein B [Bacilli bacterium]|nr:ferrous iron transport protein B [Bacilli bacterium]
MKIGLIGNPNVGKSTIFNALTGMHQHTGNWPGKTVEKCTGYRKYKNKTYQFEDLPGTYSLTAHSKEEEVTRNFVYSNNYDALVVICDAVCLERNLNLVLQVLEVTSKVIVCVNLIDEAKKKGIAIDQTKLSELLHVPVILTSARKKEGIEEILEKINNINDNKSLCIDYPSIIIDEIFAINSIIQNRGHAIKLLTGEIKENKDKILITKVKEAQNNLVKKGLNSNDVEEIVAECIIDKCGEISKKIITFQKKDYQKRDRIIDRFVTGKFTGLIAMLLLLIIIFWLTISFSNIPSDMLYNFFFGIEDNIIDFLKHLNIPSVIINPLVYGIYRVLVWVISVMLPPMAIFFPLFTLLEDLGYLPRVAFNLDKIFKKCASCGKQSLTMMMNFGCNAVGVIGARIIDSPRERLIAILTSSFIPCNGKFPILISLITMFLIYNNSNSFTSSIFLTLIILLGIIMTFIISKLLSKTILKGESSSFTLELPPYRKPQIGKVIIRSILDRTIFVLRRAIVISAPAGLVIWLMANIMIGESSLLSICTSTLDPFARSIGLDGVIIMAFILGFPANEIVIPIMIMGYMSLGYITDFDNINDLKKLFIDNGWTLLTAISTCIFALIHWPCLTTVLTIKKETGSLKWTLLSIIIPATVGIILCFLTTQIYNFVY